eukprot:jgi/Undpi1/2061/HiC_scaffold_12.g05447.m1
MKLRFLNVGLSSLLAASSSFGPASAFTIAPSALRTCLGHPPAAASAPAAFSPTLSSVQHCGRREQHPSLAGHDAAAWSGGPRSKDNSAPVVAMKFLGGCEDPAKARDVAAAASARGRATPQKVLKSAGVALAWYLGSSAAALAVASVSGIPFEPRPRKSLRIAPTLLILYLFSAKNVKKRGRFEGVIPKDEDSRRLLADDARDLAMSWGKPAGRISYTLVDMFVFLFVFRYSGLDFKKLLLGGSMAQLLSPDFWGFGYGYLRSTAASMLAPMMQAAIIKPAKTVASMAGAGSEWDTGLTPAERKGRRSSRELRESLSTFKDVDFTNDGADNSPPSSPPPPPSKDGGGDDASPPDLKRTS